MAVTVKLKDVVEELDMLSDKTAAYLNKRTGELITLSDEELSAAEDEEDPADYPEWQRESLAKAREVSDSADWLELPSKFDIHEYAIMEEFCRSVEDLETGERLLRDIRGSGAFRRFREALAQLGMEQDWYDFRAAALEGIAVKWLEANEILYTRDSESGNDN